jgi:hypothetical protein
MKRARSLGSVAAFAMVGLACGSPSTSPPAQPSAPAAGVAACGVRVFGPQYDPRCQAETDARCCALSQRCAADPACARAAACLSQCAHPNTESCAMNCMALPGMTKAVFAAYVLPIQCLLGDPVTPAISGANCNWPEGGLTANISYGKIAQPFHSVRLNANGVSDEVLIDPVGNVFREVHPWSSGHFGGLRFVRSTSPAVAAQIAADFAALPRARQETDCARGGVDFGVAQGNQNSFGSGFLYECFNNVGRFSNPAVARAYENLYRLGL